MINALIGQKGQQSQRFLEDGKRIPVTMVRVPQVPVVEVRTKNKHGYWALKIALGNKKKGTKQQLGEVKGAGVTTAPRFLREIRITAADVTEEQLPKVGDTVKALDVLKPGDIVDVVGTSKGKGFAGVVKRHNFRGGPRTHGQSDRERAPGSIGQTTTPGRVYRGKRMAGRMGQDRVTLKNLMVVAVTDDTVMIDGLIPGVQDSIVMIKKVGEAKKFVPLHTVSAPQEEVVEEAPTQEETQSEDAAASVAEEPVAEKEETPVQETEEKEDAQNE